MKMSKFAGTSWLNSIMTSKAIANSLKLIRMYELVSDPKGQLETNLPNGRISVTLNHRESTEVVQRCSLKSPEYFATICFNLKIAELHYQRTRCCSG